eukprot:GILI01006060.1.p1 GENE.GILI01006060.1~~GILI01006060.1.p1  ORF type:complete len:138 (-),score=22.81 GILI01006060.1:119-505(-)
MPPKKKGPSSSSSREEEKKSEDGGRLKACNHVKARHILCEKHSKIMEAYNKLREEHGDSPPASEFSKVAQEYSECSSGKRGGDLGWFPRGKMIGDFQEIAFNLPPGKMSQPFRTREGYHVVFVEGRRA